jgi:D-amino-acid oxidase
MPGKATVIGCGVMGLSSAIRLIEAGFEVRIIAKDLPPATTSDTAGAIWYPYRCLPEDKALDWGRITLRHYYKLMDQPESGVFPVQFTEYLPEKSSDPWWRSAVRTFSRLNAEDIPEIYKDGYLFEVPFIDTSLYMRWLMNHFRKLGEVLFGVNFHHFRKPGTAQSLS